MKHPSPFDKQADDDDAILDAVIVGGGIGGIVMLAEGVAQGATKILLLERSEQLGGIWARLPAWQTIQNHPLDFCLQGFTTRKRVWHAGDVLHFLADYVRVQRLEPFIRLGEICAAVCGSTRRTVGASSSPPVRARLPRSAAAGSFSAPAATPSRSSPRSTLTRACRSCIQAPGSAPRRPPGSMLSSSAAGRRLSGEKVPATKSGQDPRYPKKGGWHLFRYSAERLLA